MTALTQRPYEAAIQQFLSDRQVPHRHLSFDQSCHSVAEAAEAAQADPAEFVKNICMLDESDPARLIVAIVRAADRASTSRVAKFLGKPSIRLATPEEILEKSGYPCGGTPSFGFDAQFLIDSAVMDLPNVYTGGGSEYALIHIPTESLLKANQAPITRLRR